MAQLLATKLLAEAEKASDAESDDYFHFWTYKDLQSRRIVSTRTDLHRKQRLFGFPRPVVLTGGVGAAALYRVAEVKAWLIDREALALRNTEPQMKPGSRPRGRPRRTETMAEVAAET
jgi:hypothetical protein